MGSVVINVNLVIEFPDDWDTKDEIEDYTLDDMKRYLEGSWAGIEMILPHDSLKDAPLLIVHNEKKDGCDASNEKA